jgi:hypothetical protein
LFVSLLHWLSLITSLFPFPAFLPQFLFLIYFLSHKCTSLYTHTHKHMHTCTGKCNHCEVGKHSSLLHSFLLSLFSPHLLSPTLEAYLVFSFLVFLIFKL